MFVINISLGPIGKIDAASLCLLTEALADELVIRCTARCLQPTAAANFTVKTSVATVKSEGMQCLLFDIIRVIPGCTAGMLGGVKSHR